MISPRRSDKSWSGCLSIAEARAAKFTYSPPVRETCEAGKPVLTVILDCYYRLDLVRQSIDSVLAQDYPNVELILVDNGAEDDVAAYVRRIRETNANVALLDFPENQFSWDDINRAVAVCWNAALLHARGDYVVHLAYDDLMSRNYARKMVALFAENPACVTAAPLPESIDADGKVNEAFTRSMRARNTRGRYIPGIELARDVAKGNPRRLFAAPGEVFVIRKDALLEHGGFDRLSDISQVLKYCSLGDSGFDPEAKLYWRHHEGQLNKLAKSKGMVWYTAGHGLWDASGIVQFWRERFDADTVADLLSFKERQLTEGPIGTVAENVRLRKFGAAAKGYANVIRECPYLLPRAAAAGLKELAMIVPSTVFLVLARAGKRFLPPRTVQRLRLHLEKRASR